jgi:hypothetical protein
VGRVDPLLGTERGDPVTTGGDPTGVQLVGDESVAEFGVVMVDVDSGVDQVCVAPV